MGLAALYGSEAAEELLNIRHALTQVHETEVWLPSDRILTLMRLVVPQHGGTAGDGAHMMHGQGAIGFAMAASRCDIRATKTLCEPEPQSPRIPPSDVASSILDGCKVLIYLAPRVGLEPTTLRLTAECSTIELPRSKGRDCETSLHQTPRDVSNS